MHPRKRQRKNASTMKLVGKLLARFRKEAGLTQTELAQAAGVPEDTIASVEQGRRSLVPDQVIPGLLQTKAYAQAVFGNKVPVYSQEEIETHTATRLQRQQILDRKKPPTTSIVIWEPVLMMKLTSDDDHREQLRHLYAMAQLPGFCLQVLPLDGRVHAGLVSPFILLETPDHQHVAYTETQRVSPLIYDRNEVSILAQKYRCCEPRRSALWRPCACWHAYWERHEHRTELVQVELQQRRRRRVPRSRLRLAEVELQRRRRRGLRRDRRPPRRRPRPRLQGHRGPGLHRRAHRLVGVRRLRGNRLTPHRRHPARTVS